MNYPFSVMCIRPRTWHERLYALYHISATKFDENFLVLAVSARRKPKFCEHLAGCNNCIGLKFQVRFHSGSRARAVQLEVPRK